MMFARRVVSEAVGTALLLAAVVGSGFMGERLSGGNVAIALLANTMATGAMLVALILTFGLAPAYAGLASSYAASSAQGFRDDHADELTEMRAAAEKAIQLDPC
jgi:hypothetical protein